MANKDVFYGVLVVKRIIYVQYSPSRIAKDDIDTFVLKKLNDNLRAREFHTHYSGNFQKNKPLARDFAFEVDATEVKVRTFF